MTSNQQNQNQENVPVFSFTEIEVVPFKSFKDFQFDFFDTKDLVNDKLFPRLRISYYSQENGNTYYNFIELIELPNILAAFEFLLDKVTTKEKNFKEYNAQSQYGFLFGAFWVKKDGWSFFIQMDQDSPRFYPKEKELKEIYNIFGAFNDEVIKKYGDLQ